MLTRKISLICAWKCDSEVSVESEIRCYLSLAAKGFIETSSERKEKYLLQSPSLTLAMWLLINTVTLYCYALKFQGIPSARHSRIYDPAVLSFKPIQMNPSFSLAPVEEPGFAY